MTQNEDIWKKKIEDCNTAYDLLKLEKEFYTKESEDVFDKFYNETFYEKLNILLFRNEEFNEIEALKKRVKELEEMMASYEHNKRGKSCIEI